MIQRPDVWRVENDERRHDLDSQPDEYVPPLLPGKYAIIVIGVLAVSLAAGAMWYHIRLQRRAHKLWGNTTAALILRAPKVEALRIMPFDSAEPDGAGETLDIDGDTWRVAEVKDVTHARGFSHARRSLMNDQGFDWAAPRPTSPLDWQYALRFSDGDQTTTVLVCLQPARVRLLGGLSSASNEPATNGFRDFFAEQFPAGQEP